MLVSTPRSGSTLLYETLGQARSLYTTGQESHWLIEDIAALNPANRGWDSNRLTAADATPEIADMLAREFYRQLRNRSGHGAEGRVRMLEKTPKNALRVPFFAAVFPDALFVYLYRDVRPTLASMMEAWASGAFQTYPQLPGWRGLAWSMLLVPGWRNLVDQPLPVIVAHQWAITTQILLDDLSTIPRERLRVITHNEFLKAPQDRVTALARTLGLKWDRSVSQQLPLSKVTVSPPYPNKWRRLEPYIETVIPIVADADARARAFVGQHSAL
ncbi:MAG TPA: sulfotransferase [Sphingomicrobium sp.]|nr:sulfotransferase [Sphingomicrobium sp.]